MAESITLLPLICPECRTPLPAEPDETAGRCEQCGEGWRIKDDSLLPLPFNFAAGIAPGARGRPFWVAEGTVTVQRETYSGNQSSQARDFWSQPRRFFVPAFACPLDTLVSLGAQMLRQPPQLRTGEPAPFLPITVSPADVQSLAEFVVVGLEADRKDQLKQVQAHVQLGMLELWVLP